jgi:hypothetical protein
MKIRLSLAAGVLLIGALVGVAPTAAQAAPTAANVAVPSLCHPGTPGNAPATTSFYDPGKPYLGPDPLPTAAPVGPLLIGYHRFGALTEARFEGKYRTGTGWIYPPNDGFLTIAGHVVRYDERLLPGTEVDRFGYSGGAYLAPEHTLFIQRALPPQNLTSPGQTPQSNYHVYCVLKSFDVDAGPIAPWFEQIGLGLQYKLDAALVPGSPSTLSVTWLLSNGYLTEEA